MQLNNDKFSFTELNQHIIQMIEVITKINDCLEANRESNNLDLVQSQQHLTKNLSFVFQCIVSSNETVAWYDAMERAKKAQSVHKPSDEESNALKQTSELSSQVLALWN